MELSVSLGSVVGQISLPEGQDGFCIKGTLIDKVVVIGTDG